MPPRKRAETKPEAATQEPQETVAPAVEAPVDPEPQAPAVEGSDPGDEVKAEDASNADDDQPDAGEQNGEQPCTECFPNGWPADGTQVGCVHGNWARG